MEDGGDGWLVSAVVARVVCAASARGRRGMLSRGQRYGQRGDGVVAQKTQIRADDVVVAWARSAWYASGTAAAASTTNVHSKAP